jgi:NAD(P)-dependent dehydrogenase (short-subunit alcohol dehydrogenase family)
MPRVVIVTGASRGIGAATAKLLADRGFRVVVNYRSSAAQADEVVAAITGSGGEAVAIRADVTVPAEVTAMLKQVNDRWGTVDVLAHNALTPYAVTSFADLTWEQLSEKLDQELHAAYLMTKAVVPGMISQGYGRLVFLTTQLSADLRSELSKANPMGRLVRPDEVARTVAFFAGDEAAFTTGSYAPVSGGLSMD